MPRQLDQKTAVSTKAESAYGTAVANGDFDKLFNFGVEWPADNFFKEGLRVCGGEFDTAMETLTKDVTLSLGGRVYPDSIAWVLSYVLGTYSVAGAGDPYTHTNKKLVIPDYTLDSFSLMRYYDASTNLFFKYKGCQMNSFSIGGAYDGANAALNWNATALTDGTRTEVTSGYTQPSCVEENCYRTGDITITLSNYGGSAISSLDFQSFSFNISNNLETDPRRSGTAVAQAREIGERSFTASLSVIGTPSDTIDDLWQAASESYLALTISCANPTSNRVLTFTAPKMAIANLGVGFSRSNRKHTHELTFNCLLDNTSGTTIANSPWYATVQTGTATYRA